MKEPPRSVQLAPPPDELLPPPEDELEEAVSPIQRQLLASKFEPWHLVASLFVFSKQSSWSRQMLASKKQAHSQLFSSKSGSDELLQSSIVNEHPPELDELPDELELLEEELELLLDEHPS